MDTLRCVYIDRIMNTRMSAQTDKNSCLVCGLASLTSDEHATLKRTTTHSPPDLACISFVFGIIYSYSGATESDFS